MRPAGSAASAAFESALATLGAYQSGLDGIRPAVTYSPPAWDRPARSGAGPTAVGPGPLAEAAVALRSGRVTSSELVEDALRVIEKLDPVLNAIAHLRAGEARAEAAERDAEAVAGRWRGPLHGIPITVKDVIDVAGSPTRAGSDAYNRLPADDAEAVSRVRAAGAVILAKVTTHEFALGVTSPQSRNPHDPTRIPGGSSGGSAIAVSTGMGLGSIGTDTRASIRVPAALSGVVGLKPTYGTIPTGGVVTLSWTMDHVAVMGATVADAAAMLAGLMGLPGPVPGPAPLPGPLRVGVPEATFDGADPRVAGVVRRALDRLADAGWELAPASRPSTSDLDLANAAGLVVSRCEAAAFHRSSGTDRSLCWDEVGEQLALAERVAATDYLDAQRIRAFLAAGLLATFADHEVLAMPTSVVTAPPADDFARYLLVLSRNAIPWSFVGFPAMSIPCGTVDGLPVGLQLVAPPGRDDLLVATGLAAEATLGQASGRPLPAAGH